MLLRSISKHIKDQNWFAVALDFLIVVLGILIAFQITNWNEARLIQSDATASRDRLVSDLRSDRDAFAIRRQWYNEVFEAALRVDDALRAELPESTDAQWRFVRDASIAGGEWPFAPSAQIYKELQNSGGLDLIAGGPMQRRLRDYYEDAAREIEISLTFNSAYRDITAKLIDGRVGMSIATCLSAESLEPSLPHTTPEKFYTDCSLPDDVDLVLHSAASLHSSTELKPLLNARLMNLTGLRSLLEYVDRKAVKLVSDLEATQ